MDFIKIIWKNSKGETKKEEESVKSVQKKYSSSARYWYIPVLDNTGTFVL